MKRGKDNTLMKLFKKSKINSINMKKQIFHYNKKIKIQRLLFKYVPKMKKKLKI